MSQSNVEKSTMSAQQVALFLAKLSDDPAFRARLEGAANAETPKESVKAILAETGFSFTPEEYRAATRNLLRSATGGELSDQTLEKVAGGLAQPNLPPTARSFFVAGNLLSRGSKLGGLLANYRS